ncbi:MAG TPA: hypothetical protein VEC37_06595 [Bacillota bacterium]|nr:hypothetical protein [Bacillota bacterium]
MSHNPVLRWLTGCCRWLNLICIGTRVLQALFWCGTFSGLLLWALRLTRWPGITWHLWFTTLVPIGAAGLFWGWLRWVKLTGAAHWLDEHLGNHELFSAALHCLKPDSQEVFSEPILAAAEAAVAEKPKIQWPYRSLVFNAVGAICGFALVMVLFTWQFNGNGVKTNPAQAKQFREQYAILDEIVAGDGNPAQCTPRIMARILFAHDIVKANQAERALTEGDFEQLAELVSQAEREIKQKYARTENPEVKKQLAAEQKKLEKATRLLDPENRDDSLESEYQEQGLVANAAQQGGDSKTVSGRLPASGSPAGKGQRAGNRQAAGSNPGDDDDPYNDYSAETPSQAGDGKGSKDGNWGKVAARSGTERLLITSRKDGPTLEFLLPDKTTKVPLSQVLPASRRTAESAVQRDGVPAEYQHFVSNYFTELTQQTNRTKAKEDSK